MIPDPVSLGAFFCFDFPPPRSLQVALLESGVWAEVLRLDRLLLGLEVKEMQRQLRDCTDRIGELLRMFIRETYVRPPVVRSVGGAASASAGTARLWPTSTECGTRLGALVFFIGRTWPEESKGVSEAIGQLREKIGVFTKDYISKHGKPKLHAPFNLRGSFGIYDWNSIGRVDQPAGITLLGGGVEVENPMTARKLSDVESRDPLDLVRGAVVCFRADGTSKQLSEKIEKIVEVIVGVAVKQGVAHANCTTVPGSDYVEDAKEFVIRPVYKAKGTKQQQLSFERLAIWKMNWRKHLPVLPSWSIRLIVFLEPPMHSYELILLLTLPD